jgi:NTP pyrophosphatase (non-canonical NTP hydrolase)
MQNPGLTLDAFQEEALKADRAPSTSLTFPLLGLFGETGTLLSVVKKKQRDTVSYLGYAPHVVEEFGDVLWYLAVVARRGSIDLSEVGRNTIPRQRIWLEGRDPGVRFSDLQGSPSAIKQNPTPAFEETLLDVAGRVGLLLHGYRRGRYTSDVTTLKHRLATILNALVKAANEAGVSLEEAARNNLRKIFDRWPRERVYPPPLDTAYSVHERLPRYLTIDIFEREVGGKLYVFQQCHGINIGDRLTDNAVEPDDYRFHDVFHYAFSAVLTWSPVTRALFRLKRKSVPDVDEVQDGARALLIEEGIATWIFGQAKELQFFAGMAAGDLSFDMLKTIRQFAAGYEPEACPLWLWEDAILQGYEAFRFLQANRRARLTIDVGQRKLLVGELPSDA